MFCSGSSTRSSRVQSAYLKMSKLSVFQTYGNTENMKMKYVMLKTWRFRYTCELIHVKSKARTVSAVGVWFPLGPTVLKGTLDEKRTNCMWCLTQSLLSIKLTALLSLAYICYIFNAILEFASFWKTIRHDSDSLFHSVMYMNIVLTLPWIKHKMINKYEVSLHKMSLWFWYVKCTHTSFIALYDLKAPFSEYQNTLKFYLLSIYQCR